MVQSRLTPLLSELKSFFFDRGFIFRICTDFFFLTQSAKSAEFDVKPEVNTPQTPHMTHGVSRCPLGVPTCFGSPGTAWMGLRYVNFGVVGYGAHEGGQGHNQFTVTDHNGCGSSIFEQPAGGEPKGRGAGLLGRRASPSRFEPAHTGFEEASAHQLSRLSLALGACGSSQNP